MNDIEIKSRESECENLRLRIIKEKLDFESEYRERQLREIQYKEIKIEERRDNLAKNE